MKVALSDVSPWVFRTLCLGLGSAVLFAVLRAGGQSLAVPKGQRLRLALLAFFNITCWNLLVAFGMTMIPSGRAAILAYMMPAWAIPVSVWLLGERLTGAKIAGLALGMVGLALLLGEAIAAHRNGFRRAIVELAGLTASLRLLDGPTSNSAADQSTVGRRRFNLFRRK